MREVQHRAGDERRCPVGEDVAELRGEVGHGRRRRERHREPRMTQDLEVLLQGRPRVAERERFVRALVVGLAPRELARAGDPCGPADVAANVEDVSAVARRRVGGGVGQRERSRPQTLGRPRRLVPPRATHLRPGRARSCGSLREEHDRRFAVDPVVLVLEPAIPPADHLGDKVDVRPGQRDVRRCVGPGSDHQSCRTTELLERPQRVVAIAVGPPGDDHGRRLDPVVVGAERSEAPIVVEALVREPREHPRLGPAHAAFPLARATRRRRSTAPAATRSSRSCTSGSRPGRAASTRRRSSGRRPRTDRRSRRSG